MNINTGEIIDTGCKTAPVYLDDGWAMLPEDLNRAAKRALRGRESVIISPTSGGKLSNWAKQKRKQAQASKRQNRKG